MQMFLRLADVLKLTGFCRGTLYNMMAAGTFPKPIKISPRLNGWQQSDIEAWAAERAADRVAA